MKIENIIIEQNAIWSVDVEDNNIKIEHNATRLELIINNKLQDIFPSTFRWISIPTGRLKGKLMDGKEVKVVFGGFLKLHIYIFVDNELVLKS